MSWMRQSWFLAVLVLALGLLAAPAFAGSYLDRAGLFVTQATQEADYLRNRLSDKELARVVRDMARARLATAGSMNVPKEVTQAHPHLLLVLENYERAADAAVDGQSERFLIYQLRARDEERVLRGVLKQLGWSLPDKH